MLAFWNALERDLGSSILTLFASVRVIGDFYLTQIGYFRLTLLGHFRLTRTALLGKKDTPSCVILQNTFEEFIHDGIIA